MDKEWYLLEYERRPELRNKVLKLLKYPSEKGKHDHCELCWDRFSSHPSDQQIGYYNSEEKMWICVECYKNYKDLFGWEEDKS